MNKSFTIVFSLILFPLFLSAQTETQFPKDIKYAYNYEGNTIFTDAVRIAGISYKVEVMHLPYFDKNDPGLKKLRQYGTIAVEKWKDEGEYVLLIGTFESQEKATSIRNKLRDIGFNDSRIVRYQDGLRK